MSLGTLGVGSPETPSGANRLKAQAPRTTRKVVLALAILILAVATLGVVSPPPASAATAALVQDRNTLVTGGTSASLAFSKANTAGDLIVAYVVWDNRGTVNVSDTGKNTYTAATPRQNFGSSWSAQVFYAPNIIGGSNTVKATFGTAITSFGIVYLHEYSGLATVNPVDVTASAAGTPAAMSSGAVATTQANDLLFGAGASDSTVTAAGTGFTKRLTGYGNMTEDRVVTTTGSYAATASQNGAAWVMQLVAFRVASSSTGPPTKLAFIKGPSNANAGATISPAVTVAVEDANGNVETTDNATTVSLAIGTNPGGGTLTGGSAVTVASGVATFSGLSINDVGTGYNLTASSTPSYTAATSAAFNITGTGPPTKLAFIKGPSNAAAGATITPSVTVAVEDANGNVETTDNATTVSLAIGTNPGGGTLTGGSAVTVAFGVATFSALSINDAGTGYTLKASSTPARTAATSAAFNITAVTGPPTKLAFIEGPSSAATGATISPAVTVAVEDANGNVETTDNATTVSLAIGTNPGGGTLTGGSAVTVASGVATFSGLSINDAGTGYTLTASSTPSYTAATSAAFNIITGTSSADWTTYLQGLDRTDLAPDSGFTPASAANLHLAWQASDSGSSGLDHGVFAQPIVSNGLVYWGSSDGYERANDTNGNPIWQTFLGHTVAPQCTDPSSFGIASSGTVTSDVPVGTATSVLYVGGGDSKFYALNAATGAVLWSYDVGGNPQTFIWSSPAVFGNSVYFGVSSFGTCPFVQGQLVQLNRTTGALENTFDVVPNGCIGGGVWGSPTIDAAAGTIYFATGSTSDCPSGPETMAPALVEVNASNLSLVGSWAVPLAQQNSDSDFGSTPTLFTGVIGGQPVNLVGAINKNGIYYALKRDALAAGPVWQVPIAIGGVDPTTGNGDVASSAFDGTTLYVGGDATNACSGSLSALNPSTGAFIWQHCFSDGGYVLGGVTVTSGGVVAVGEANNIAVFSAATGASLYTFTGSGTFWGPPSIVSGTLYEGDMAGQLYALTSQSNGAQFVQINSATPQANENAVSVPYLQAQSAGDLNVVAVGFNNSTSTITSVTDSAGNVYQLAAPLTRGSSLSQALYYAKDINAATAGTNVVTVQFSGAVPYVDVRAAEYSGIDPVNPLDTTASAVGSGATASSGNLTTSAANEVIFGAGMTTGSFAGGTNGFTTRIITPVDGDIAVDQFATASGTFAATASEGSAKWVMQAVAFRVAA